MGSRFEALDGDDVLVSEQVIQPHNVPKDRHKLRKRVSLICSSIAALASGTPYLYGVYSPQLINRCGFTAIDSSYLSFGGNIGSSIGGFLAGLIIDAFGVKAGLLLGAFLQFSGFFTLYINFKNEWHYFIQLLFAMCSIGFGSVLSYFATIKVATLNFPNHRGLANAFPVSSYGLAALFYAFVSTFWFTDNVEGLLRFIACFSGILISISSIFICIYENGDEGDEDDEQIDTGGHYNTMDSSVYNEEDERRGPETSKNEMEVGIEYLLKGHRGSFAQINNFNRSDSSSSLFSDMTGASSMVSTSASSSSRLPPNFTTSATNIPIQNSSNFIRSDSLNKKSVSSSEVSSSPFDLRVQRNHYRASSFKLSSSINNSPRNATGFNSFSNLKQFKDNPNVSEDLSLSIERSASSTPETNQSSNILPQSLCEIQSSPMASDSDVGGAKPHGLYDASQFVQSNTTQKASPNKRKRHKRKTTTKEHITQLFRNQLFLSHYILNAFYCAIGQVYIFSIGFIVRAQVNYYNMHKPSEITFILQLAEKLTVPHGKENATPSNLAVAYQALQVSIISFSNFLGRLISGPTSDLIHKKMKKSKIYVLAVSTIIMGCGQVSLVLSNKLDLLSLISFSIGLAYGAIYGTMPSIVADSFGAKNFATTWSLLGTGPITIFLLLSNYFGSIYDENSEWGYIGDDRIKMCLLGKNCYSSVFTLTSLTCLMIFIFYNVLIQYSKKQ